MKHHTRRKLVVDKVRASREGHEYHEAWTARRAMQLLWPESDLTAIAVEGFPQIDQRRASAAAVEIADLVLYYGAACFEHAKRTTIAQLKYSIARSAVAFRAADAKQTIEKFATAYQDHNKNYGLRAVENKLDFELITNRPIYPPLLQAIEALAKGLPNTGEISKQANQFKAASGLDGKLLANFARKCKFVGLTGTLTHTKDELAGLIVDWSATNDPLATARLGQLRQMVRDKAGSAGTKNNLIMRTDILSALHVGDPEDLLPSKPAIPDVGEIVEREQLSDALSRITGLSMPFLIHAAGGVGKTVFMTSLASAMRDQSEAVFFDCFGGGAYRSPEDARHLPKRGLIHIANTLAFRGLCDPILPDSTDVQILLSTFRRRLEQCVKTLNTATPGRGIALFIDAIDNAALVAQARSEEAFPLLLLDSIHHKPIAGVRLIVSCRTERRPSTDAQYEEFELRPFNLTETAAYLRPRLPHVSQVEIKVAQARSGGNPRVLEYLVKSGRGLLDESEINKGVKLDDLIQQRIDDALAVARERGYLREDIDAFLAGLAVLPPPVPLDEYAGAHGLEISLVESFAADLSPLLERTNQGLMFRDEPTETLVRNQYANSPDALRRVAVNLLARQDSSVYAARALPGLLHTLDDGEQLFQLAFDDRIPTAITTTVGKRNIRYARIKAAVLHTAIKNDHNRLVRLLVELSSIVAVDQRGANYILEYPDLVVAAKDVDALRRLFETRTDWPGTRHARLAIANSLAGESEEANRHARMVQEWVNHYLRTDREDRPHEPRPERPDIAAVPFFLLCEDRPQDAANVLKSWRDWYAYEVCEYVIQYFQLAESLRPVSPDAFGTFIDALTNVGPLAAALSFHNFPTGTRKDLLVRLHRACKRSKKLHLRESVHRDRPYELQDGLRQAAALALSVGLTREALGISLHAPTQRAGLWSLRDRFYTSDEVFPFVFRVALLAAAKNQALHEKDVLPAELVPVCASINRQVTGKSFREKVKSILPKFTRKGPEIAGETPEPGTLSYDQTREAVRFIDHRLEPLLALAQAFASFLSSPQRAADKAFGEVLRIWKDARRDRDPFQTRQFDSFFRFLGLEVALFALRVRTDLRPSSVRNFLTTLHSQSPSPGTLVGIVALLARRGALHALAGEQALNARKLIEAEDDVTHRATLFADLGRAMLPASIDEASVYFRDGLEQMDAIGSGDHVFTNELLLFAAAMKGGELDEGDFHTLTNICELNMPEEPEKFVWCAFGKGMSKAAGVRGLAKLSRWDDRSKIDLDHTLLPYLTALVADGKIEPDVALCLNRLARPVEYWYCGTKEFAGAIRSTAGAGRRDVIAELIQQYEDDYHSLYGPTVEILASLAEETLGGSSDTTSYLSAVYKREAELRATHNDHMNYRGEPNARLDKRLDEERIQTRARLQAIAAATDPTDQASLAEAIKEATDLGHIFDFKGDFFKALRAKVPFNRRAEYIRHLCSLQTFHFPWKLTELKDCRDSWVPSSAALGAVFKDQALALVQLHADELIRYDRLSGSDLYEIAELTGVPIAALVLELIKMFARTGTVGPGAVWLSLASFVVEKADEGQGQLALARLLRSEAARLTNSVADGAWKNGLYPEDNVQAVAVGLLWRMLGSPHAESRWRAAHSIRCFARFGRWNIVDALVGKLASEKTAGPFQAEELAFYFLHARLWLLIALARMALDHPKEIARYQDTLLRIAEEMRDPHVLMRHFAARSLVACIVAGELKLPSATLTGLRKVDLSPYPHLKQKTKTGGGFYQGRPASAKNPKVKFHLDYDFHKHSVDSLSSVFGKPLWEIEDSISEIVHKLAPTASSMYDQDGRLSPRRDDYRGMTSTYHSNGQQLGWHALFFAAGRLLRDSPITDDWWYKKDPWGEWLSRYVLTRDDGLWLSDGMDRRPLDTDMILLEKGKKDLTLTGDREKLLKLVGITSRIGKELVVEGSWRSADNIQVHISSALVRPEKAQRLTRKLIREDPMRIWLPMYEEDGMGGEYLQVNRKNEYTPWIVSRSRDAKLDGDDPFGAPIANSRSRISSDYAQAFTITTEDPFSRTWYDKHKRVVARAQAWGRESKDGLRLLCSAPFLKIVLGRFDKELLLLIKLEKYESQSYQGQYSKFMHTVAVVRVKATLDFEYFPGRINHVYESRF